MDTVLIPFQQGIGSDHTERRCSPRVRVLIPFQQGIGSDSDHEAQGQHHQVLIPFQQGIGSDCKGQATIRCPCLNPFSAGHWF